MRHHSAICRILPARRRAHHGFLPDHFNHVRSPSGKARIPGTCDVLVHPTGMNCWNWRGAVRVRLHPPSGDTQSPSECAEPQPPGATVLFVNLPGRPPDVLNGRRSFSPKAPKRAVANSRLLVAAWSETAFEVPMRMQQTAAVRPMPRPNRGPLRQAPNRVRSRL
jgi:hypothetical protein